VSAKPPSKGRPLLQGRSTRAAHAGGRRDPASGSMTTPVLRTSTFRFATTDDLEAGARGERPGFYTRYGHPNFRAVEEKFAALHGAEDAVLFGSGMAAVAAVVQSLAKSGERVVALRDVYGGTRDLLAWLEPHAGIRTTWVPTREREALERALSGAKVLWAESPTNPLLKVLDVPALAALARRHGVPFVLDSTFAGPALQQPIALGADLVMESATKSLGGHSDLLGGLVAGRAALLGELKKARKLLGGVMDPETAWLLERSMKTVVVRAERQAATAVELAERLAKDPRVTRVLHPLRKDHPDHGVAQRTGLKGVGLVTFACRGGLRAARRLADRVELIANAPSLGGVESLLSLPVLTSHAMFTPAERVEAGITDDLVRLSVGLEDADDLWADLDAAMGQALGSTRRRR
jgi:cystathionine beta-lyase/cystathionine gamma-synthase